jgi:hypothetical protein
MLLRLMIATARWLDTSENAWASRPACGRTATDARPCDYDTRL